MFMFIYIHEYIHTYPSLICSTDVHMYMCITIYIHTHMFFIIYTTKTANAFDLNIGVQIEVNEF